MKATPSKKFNLLFFIFAFLIISSSHAMAETPKSESGFSAKLQSIESKLNESAEREKQILAKQDDILQEITRSRTWRRKP